MSTLITMRERKVIPFPVTRHLQRYEYVSKRGWVLNKTVVDVGCGNAQGTYILAENAVHVAGTDPILKPYLDREGKLKMLAQAVRNTQGTGTVSLHAWTAQEVPQRYDVGVCVEVFEHQKDPKLFINDLSCICNELFITTPMAAETGPTRNPDHVAEYSHEDFKACVETAFIIQETAFQTGDMLIQNYAPFEGDSFDEWHIVQMLWCKRK